MLLQYSVKGYKMFVERATLSMEAAPKQKDLEYSLIKKTINGKERKVASSAVIYGPNAAGKSALVSSLDDFRAIVGRGSISAAGGGRDLSLVPHSSLNESNPIAFDAVFTKGETLYEYRLEADLGRFGHARDPRSVAKESLVMNGMAIFSRSGPDVSVNIPKSFEGRFSKRYLENRDTADELLSPVDPEDLFLSNGFRTLVSPQIAKEVADWFLDDLMVIPRAYDTSIFPHETLPQDVGALGAHLSEAGRIFGTSAKDRLVFLRREGSDEPARLYTAVEVNGDPIAVPSEIYESLGTLRFLNMLPFIEAALTEGKTLVMDELDASIHPMAVMSIVNAFHDDGVNVRGAQLIFTTHNPILLDGSLFRRDEIKFVERDESTGHGITYALSDFGTSGQQGVRRGEDYQRNYFMGKYGGIKDIDLVPFLKEQVERGIHIQIEPSSQTFPAKSDESVTPDEEGGEQVGPALRGAEEAHRD